MQRGVPRPDDEQELTPSPKRTKKVPERVRIFAQLMKSLFSSFEKVAEVNPYFERKWAVRREDGMQLEAADMTQFSRGRRAAVLKAQNLYDEYKREGCPVF